MCEAAKGSPEENRYEVFAKRMERIGEIGAKAVRLTTAKIWNTTAEKFSGKEIKYSMDGKLHNCACKLKTELERLEWHSRRAGQRSGSFYFQK